MRLRTLLPAIGIVAFTGLALGIELPNGFGVQTPSGSKFTSTITVGGECDDYVFLGYSGQKLTASVKAGKVAKKAKTALDLQLIGPGGVQIDPVADGAKVKDKGTSVKFQFVLNRTGIWKVRVLTKNPADTADYTVSVKYGAPKPAKFKNLDQEANPDRADHIIPGGGQYIFGLPGVGGAEISAKFSFKGGTAAIAFFQDPNGNLVDFPDDVSDDVPNCDPDGDPDDVPPDCVPDGVPDAVVKASGNKIQIKKLLIPAGLPAGDYILGFNDVGAQSDPTGELLAKVGFSAKVKIPKSGEKKRKANLDENEPRILSLTPPVGGQGTEIFFEVQNSRDRNDIDGDPTLLVGGVPLTNVQTVGNGGDRFKGTVPAIGGNVGDFFDVVYMTSTGQLDVEQNAFRIVAPPTVGTISQSSGSVNGGFELTITGTNFRPDPTVNIVTIDGFDLPLVPTTVTETSVTFTAPQRSAGFVAYGIKDRDSQLGDSLRLADFEYIAAPSIIRVSPNLAPVTGGDTISVVGVNFDAADVVFIETEVAGVFEALAGTFISGGRHAFPAPVRAKGAYQVFVRDPQGQDTPGQFFLNYFTFSDFTGSTALSPPPGTDLYDAHTTALGDYNNDGLDDLFLSHLGKDDADTKTLTRVLENNGDGSFTDVTDEVIPAVTATDDWRADRIAVVDVNDDNFADIVIVTNSTSVPAANKSAVRVLKNVPRVGGGPGTRAFVDDTTALMPPVRMKSPFSFGGGTPTIADNWRGIDMWIGDIDNSNDNRPEILIVHDEVKNEPNVNCGNYCTSPQGGGATYNFYWGGSRAFTWDPAAAGGNGRFKFDVGFFPRKSGVGVPIPIPGGGKIVGCSVKCEGTFTPFIGKKIAVGHIDTDGKLDVATLHDGVVTRSDIGQISSLQIAVNKSNIMEGSSITDTTHKLTALGGDNRGDAVTIGQPFGFFGAIAISKRTHSGSRVLKIFQAKQPLIPDEPTPDFTDVSSTVLPAVGANDKFQASAMEFRDTNGDSIQDLVLLAPDAPGGNEMALRILRGTVVGQSLVLRETFKGLLAALTAGGDNWDGDVLTIGDINDDGEIEFIVTRETPFGLDTQTRIITTDK